jgi:hypothetical protein
MPSQTAARSAPVWTAFKRPPHRLLMALTARSGHTRLPSRLLSARAQLVPILRSAMSLVASTRRWRTMDGAVFVRTISSPSLLARMNGSFMLHPSLARVRAAAPIGPRTELHARLATEGSAAPPRCVTLSR